ncbi:MAG TPA: phenylalanine--tRNA ligase subunit alpha [Candidatus Gracilibacteria bacterium]
MSQGELERSLKKVSEEAEEGLKTIKNLEMLGDWYQAFLGKKSPFNAFFVALKDLSNEDKKEYGPRINTLRNQLEGAYASKKEALEIIALNEKLKDDRIDVTKSFAKKQGTLHPLSQVQRQVEDVFVSMGFEIADGPEVETEWFNFDALNIPGTHPARDMQDTFFVNHKTDNPKKNTVLRTHGTCIDIRKMCEKGAPIRTIAPARVFRNEALDATHDAIFYQVDGCLVDKNISLADLKGALKSVLSAVFERDIKIRVRPGYFPFVEPGLEIDIWWEYIDKNGEAAGRWLEFCGAGMLHPNVLRHCDIDPDEYNGFAFGFGLTRLVMMKYGIEDIRHLFSFKKEFLEQF